MRIPLRAAARAIVGSPIPRFQSVEEFLGLGSVLVLFLMLALQSAPEREPDIGRGAASVEPMTDSAPSAPYRTDRQAAASPIGRTKLGAARDRR